MLSIYDDWLPQDQWDQVKSYFTSCAIPWNYNNRIVGDHIPLSESMNPLDNWQMAYTFYTYRNPYKALKFIQPMVFIYKKLNPYVIYRLKANLRPRTDYQRASGWHTDIDDCVNSTTGILYINTCNGYTEFKDTDQKVYSKENRLITFPSKWEHRATSCTDDKCRMVLNLNYTPQPVEK